MRRYKLKDPQVRDVWCTSSGDENAIKAQYVTPNGAEYVQILAWQLVNLEIEKELGDYVHITLLLVQTPQIIGRSSEARTPKRRSTNRLKSQSSMRLWQTIILLRPVTSLWPRSVERRSQAGSNSGNEKEEKEAQTGYGSSARGKHGSLGNSITGQTSAVRGTSTPKNAPEKKSKSATMPNNFGGVPISASLSHSPFYFKPGSLSDFSTSDAGSGIFRRLSTTSKKPNTFGISSDIKHHAEDAACYFYEQKTGTKHQAGDRYPSGNGRPYIAAYTNYSRTGSRAIRFLESCSSTWSQFTPTCSDVMDFSGIDTT
ncbi:hypothetical protein P154DRAFT_580765 [Amniculicola lignicola CBS 123094]|uniref:Uncharacterized protein n=1 Tax=Amniculicola lignicola CBS 123094 TaxID=1392246 RepID=A0A6A5W3S2_9PLEO|nr:hypothetical protein P154DRAFT_580765 [Amniculicola lignicola CBS 123094]